MGITAAQRAAAQRDIEAVRATRAPKAEAAKPAEAAPVRAKVELAQPTAEVTPVTKVIKPEPTRIEAAKEVVQQSIENLSERAAAAVDELLLALGTCSPKRYLVAFVLSLSAAIGVGWLIGQVIAWCMAAVLVSTGSSFLATLVLAVGLIIAFFAGKKVGGTVMEYIVCRHADAHWARIKGFFSRPAAAPVQPAQPGGEMARA